MEYNKFPKVYVERKVVASSRANIVAPKYSGTYYVVVENPNLVSVSVYWVVSVVVPKVGNADPVVWSCERKAAGVKLDPRAPIAKVSRERPKCVPKTCYRNVSANNKFPDPAEKGRASRTHCTGVKNLVWRNYLERWSASPYTLDPNGRRPSL